MSFRGKVGDVVETGRRAGVISLEWRIPNYLSLSSYFLSSCQKGDRYESPLFDSCHGRWCFKLHPNGMPWLDDGMVHLFLYKMDTGLAQTLNIILGIRGAQGVERKRERLQELSVNDPACFWYGLCSRSELSESNYRLMPDKVLIISMDMKIDIPSILRDSFTQTVEEAEVPAEKPLSREKPGVEELQKSFRELLATGEDSDVLLKVRGKEFPAHRAILRSRSAVFQAMFSHDMVEKQSGVVTIDDCDSETFPEFLEHVYTGSVEFISLSNVFSLYTASEKYDLSTLKNVCTEFIKSNLSVCCFCDAIALAVKHDEKGLIECATEFFCGNTVEIFKTVEWQIFLKENTTIGNELLIKAFSK